MTLHSRLTVNVRASSPFVAGPDFKAVVARTAVSLDLGYILGSRTLHFGDEPTLMSQIDSPHVHMKRLLIFPRSTLLSLSLNQRTLLLLLVVLAVQRILLSALLAPCQFQDACNDELHSQFFSEIYTTPLQNLTVLP